MATQQFRIVMKLMLMRKQPNSLYSQIQAVESKRLIMVQVRLVIIGFVQPLHPVPPASTTWLRMVRSTAAMRPMLSGSASASAFNLKSYNLPASVQAEER